MNHPLRVLFPATPPRAVLTHAQIEALRADVAAALTKVAGQHGASQLLLDGHRIHKSGFNLTLRIEFPASTTPRPTGP